MVGAPLAIPHAEVIGDATAVVTPGYVNAHQHLTGDRLVRSCIPDAIDAQDAIFGWAVPIHAAHTADDDHLSATLSLVEAVGNGVTCTVEAGTVAHPERVADSDARGGRSRHDRAVGLGRRRRAAVRSRRRGARPVPRAAWRPTRAAVSSRAGSRSSGTT